MHVDLEGNANCPVSLDMLGKLYRAEPSMVGKMVELLPESDRVQLALYCYGRAHLRDVALTVAALCDAKSLSRLGGVLGQVLSAQSSGVRARYGEDAPRCMPGKRPVTLARSAA